MLIGRLLLRGTSRWGLTLPRCVQASVKLFVGCLGWGGSLIIASAAASLLA
ncbi:MAG: hypothetical protein U0350_36510 [Caldilineaceae bacterium]